MCGVCVCLCVFFTITLSDSAANQNRRDPRLPPLLSSPLQTLPISPISHKHHPCLCAVHYTGKHESAGLVSPLSVPIKTIMSCQKSHEMRYQVILWAYTSCSAHLGCRIGFGLSQGAEILSCKQTLQEQVHVYNCGPAGGVNRERGCTDFVPLYVFITALLYNSLMWTAHI